MQGCRRGILWSFQTLYHKGKVSSSCASSRVRTITSEACTPLLYQKRSFLLLPANKKSSVLSCSYQVRKFSSEKGETKGQVTDGEIKLKDTIRKSFPNATNITVEDISGGCGSMYQVFIESEEFKGLSTVKQHLLVNNALKQEIKNMHGIRIQTAAPKS